MQRVALDPKNWEGATEWVRDNEVSENVFRLKPLRSYIYWAELVFEGPGGIKLRFQATRNLEFLLAINFGRRSRVWTGMSTPKSPQASWTYESDTEPPANLEALINLGGAAAPLLKRRLQKYPAFAEVYDEIHGRLFPRLEHWKLHTGEEEYAEGSEIERLIKDDLSLLGE